MTTFWVLIFLLFFGPGKITGLHDRKKNIFLQDSRLSFRDALLFTLFGIIFYFFGDEQFGDQHIFCYDEKSVGIGNMEGFIWMDTGRIVINSIFIV